MSTESMKDSFVHSLVAKSALENKGIMRVHKEVLRKQTMHWHMSYIWGEHATMQY